MARFTLILSVVMTIIALLGGVRYLVNEVRLARWRKRQTGKWLLLLALCLTPSIVYSHAYYNSAETGCDGSNSAVLMCDDFEDGVWYATDCDTDGGITNPANDGWCGDIFNNPITPANAIVSGVTPFGTYAGTAGEKQGVGGRNQAIHHFKTPGCGTNGTELCGVQEIYVRWYTYYTAGYQFGAEKHMNITNSDADIAFANVQLNCGAGSASSDATPSIQIIHGEDLCQAPNVQAITIESGKWYFFELHLIAHATDGTIELWINDCGAAGTSCGASPVLRTLMTGVNLPGNNNGSAIESIWVESWANPASVGTGPYWDNIKVATTGPIGFSDSEGGGGGPSPTVGGLSGGSMVFFVEVIPVVSGVIWHFRHAILSGLVLCWFVSGAVLSVTAQKTKQVSYQTALLTVHGVSKLMEKARRE